MMAGPSHRRDIEGDLRDGSLARHGNRIGKTWTAGEMTVQTSVGQHSNFSAQQGLVRLVGYRAPR
jgi:hypothetical protein